MIAGFGAGAVASTLAGRQEDAEKGAFARLADNFDIAVMALHDAEHCRQAQSAAREFGGEERVENALQRFRRHTAAVVGDLERHETSRLDLRAAARWRAQPCGPQTMRIRITPGASPMASAALMRRFMTICWICPGSASTKQSLGGEVELHRDAARNGGAQQGEVVAHQPGEIELLENEAAAGIGQHLVAEIGRALRREHDVGQAGAGFPGTISANRLPLPRIATSGLLKSWAMP